MTQELPMTEAKRTSIVSRAEFYTIASLLLLLPALLFLASGSFPDTLLRQIAVLLTFITMIGLSITFNVMAIVERARRAKEKEAR
jgi:hypothetical protein